MAIAATLEGLAAFAQRRPATWRNR